MKIKLTPELSYLIGMWSKRKAKEGLGIEAPKEVQEIFAKCALEQGLTTSDKMLSSETKIYFYHGKWRKFFQEIESEKFDRYKYINEYSASYLAGLFDAVGRISEQGIIYLTKFGNDDELLLLRLGFPTMKKEHALVIGKPKAFLTLIRNYTRMFAGHQIMSVLKKKARRGRAPAAAGQGT